LVGIAVCLVRFPLALFGRRLYRAYRPEPGIDEQGVVTVVSVISGFRGKNVSACPQNGRLDVTL
jgi:hypothetical protein